MVLVSESKYGASPSSFFTIVCISENLEAQVARFFPRISGEKSPDWVHVQTLPRRFTLVVLKYQNEKSSHTEKSYSPLEYYPQQRCFQWHVQLYFSEFPTTTNSNRCAV
jgi:hypothetical protein